MGNQNQAELTTATESTTNEALTGWARVFHETVLPLAIAVITVGIFTRLDQAREALFGTIGPAPHSLNGSPPTYDHYIGPQFFALVFAIALLGIASWYSARLLLTIDRNKRHPIAASNRSRAVQSYPRLIGAFTAAALILALVGAEVGPGDNHNLRKIWALLAVLLPLCATVYAVHRGKLDRPFLVLAVLFACSPWYGVIASRPKFYSGTVVGALALLCYLPPILYALLTFRRMILAKSGRTVRTADDSIPFDTRGAALRLGLLGLIGVALLLMLGFGPSGTARTLGSSALALFAVTAVLLTLSALTLVVRRLAHNRPGFLPIGITALTAVYLLLHAIFGWTPFDERLGEETLEPVKALSGDRTTQTATTPDIVVNAYGGGLRAALFTAQVLADLDDRSCGAFGTHLGRLSGVSGGSLGIATYLVLRQEFVASGGWTDCQASHVNRPQLSLLVNDTLLQDHLSAPLARMLSTDLIPAGAPRRGQALLDSWQDALTSVLKIRGQVERPGKISLSGFAMPLRELNGGVLPAPAVYFNATDVATGERFWFSNGGTYGNAEHPQTVGSGFQVGQAVLHSARFPVVSPAGRYTSSGAGVTLVDGGYADNSGASTLLDTGKPANGQHWLNIDGNPPEKLCQDSVAKPAKGFFSGADALFAVRESQARLAVRRFQLAGAHDLSLKPDNDKAFASTMQDPHDRCEFVQGLRSAPLGWFLSPVTVGDQDNARLQAVTEACAALRPLCGD